MIHFWQLPDRRNYTILNEDFKKDIIERAKKVNFEYKIFRRLKRNRIKVKTIKEISNKLNIGLDKFEKEVYWLGALNSKGITKPKLPFDLNSRQGARFIAAIINDGCLVKEGINSYGRLLYSNTDKTIRNSVIRDYVDAFGGNPNEVAFRNNIKNKYLEFTSVIRDIMFLLLKEKGFKSESNLEVPKFILRNNYNMIGWIEQTIADEGNINYHLERYRRAIIWKRALDITNLFSRKVIEEIPFRRLPKNLQNKIAGKKCRLIESDVFMLSKLGIKYKTYIERIYPIKTGRIRSLWQIHITQRENLLKLRQLITIPSKIKDRKFTNMCNEFRRYKEPLKVKQAVLELGKNNKTFISIQLQRKMKYKYVTTTNKWLRHFEKENLIKKVRESKYGNGYYRKPAEYILSNTNTHTERV